MDELVGAKVAEVMMKNLQSRLGKEDGAWLKKDHPNANLNELINLASEWDRLARLVGGNDKFVHGKRLRLLKRHLR